MKTPSAVYVPSKRQYQGDDFECKYPFGFETRVISNRGYIKIEKERYFLSDALRGMVLGVEQRDDYQYRIWLGEFPIAILDTQLASVLATDILKKQKEEEVSLVTDLPMS